MNSTKKIVSVRFMCDEFDVPEFMRKMADFIENNKSCLDADNHYEHNDKELGSCEFDYNSEYWTEYYENWVK